MRDPRSLEVGLILPSWSASSDASVIRFSDVLALAREAEDAGFDSVWIADTLLVSLGQDEAMGYWECWSLLSALAASTTRLALGSLVTCTNFRSPALLAKMVDTVDEISGGRVILALGAGDSPFQHLAYGFPWEHRFQRFEEALTIITTLLRTGSIDFEGRYCEARHCTLFPRGPRAAAPPVVVGTVAHGPRMMRIAAQQADGWNGWLAWGRSHPDEMINIGAALDSACRDVGRDPGTLSRSVAIGVALPGHRLMFGPDDIHAGALSGPPEQLASDLVVFADAGVSHIQVLLAPSTPAGVAEFAKALELVREGTAKADLR